MSWMPWFAPSPRTVWMDGWGFGRWGEGILKERGRRSIHTHCHCVRGVSYHRHSTLEIIPHVFLGYEIFQRNDFCGSVVWNIHDASSKGVGPTFGKNLHQLDSLRVCCWDLQWLIDSHESFSVWPTDQDLAFVCIRVLLSGILERCVEKREEQKSVGFRIAALKEEWIERAHLKCKTGRVDDADA